MTQPGRGFARKDDRAQCYAFPDTTEAKASNVLITGNILVRDNMDSIVFDMGPTINMCLLNLHWDFI